MQLSAPQTAEANLWLHSCGELQSSTGTIQVWRPARETTVGLKTTTAGGDVELVTALEAFPVGKDVFALTDYGPPKCFGVFFSQRLPFSKHFLRAASRMVLCTEAPGGSGWEINDGLWVYCDGGTRSSVWLCGLADVFLIVYKPVKCFFTADLGIASHMLWPPETAMEFVLLVPIV